MKTSGIRATLLAAALIGAMAAGFAVAQTQPGQYGYGMGPGMMGGYGPGYGMGPGMMGGYGPGQGGGYGGQGGYGMGPGMMGGYGGQGGYGMGPGMMGGGMMGGGMMGGGMMGGMMGPGMMGGGMGYGMLYQLNLSPEQWSKVNAAHQDISRKQWDLIGKMREEGFKLRNLMAAEKRDRAAITAQYKKIQDFRLQTFQARLDAHEKIDAILTNEQKSQVRRFAPWWGQDME